MVNTPPSAPARSRRVGLRTLFALCCCAVVPGVGVGVEFGAGGSPVNASETRERAPRLWAELHQDAELWTVKPQFVAPADGATTHFDYVLTAHKNGRSGRSETRQSGRIHLGLGQQATLGSLRIALHDGDRCQVRISVSQALQPVGELTLELPPPSQ